MCSFGIVGRSCKRNIIKVQGEIKTTNSGNMHIHDMNGKQLLSMTKKTKSDMCRDHTSVYIRKQPMVKYRWKIQKSERMNEWMTGRINVPTNKWANDRMNEPPN